MITVDSSNIILQDTSRGEKIRLIFTHTLSDARVMGPYVEHRFEEEDLEVFLSNSRVLFEASLNQEIPSEEEVFLRMILEKDKTFLKDTLVIDQKKIDELNTKADTISTAEEIPIDNGGVIA